ncbi:MAG: biopolymer transporter ExbD [Prevotellaceae bacterium]|jgi:biopolymer transport protein ExbD|nr:biopolymer transporter ExbD [Prevotellaceae bacterium]
MAKIKTKKRDTFIDMTAMSDVTVLLLTFFMLTANFIPLEPVQVITPASVMETKVPDYNVITVLIEPTGKVFLNFDRPNDKREILEKMGVRYNITFSEKEKANFMEPTTFLGVSIAQLKEYLSLDAEDQKDYLRQSNGVPADSANNQLATWIQTAKAVNRDLSISIKADQTTPYPLVRTVTSTLQDIKENRFSLITTLRNMPEGF